MEKKKPTKQTFPDSLQQGLRWIVTTPLPASVLQAELDLTQSGGAGEVTLWLSLIPSTHYGQLQLHELQDLWSLAPAIVHIPPPHTHTMKIKQSLSRKEHQEVCV